MTWLAEDLKTLRELTVERVERAICEQEPEHLVDHQDWAHQCHSVSLEIVRSGLFVSARVARGICTGVTGQHSWVVIGDDCYDRSAPILDATLWSYVTAPILWKGSLRSGLHRPYGSGNLFQGARPAADGGKVIELTPTAKFSQRALDFIDFLGPLDARGWMMVAHLPVEGWPAREIIEAMLDTPDTRALVPIDIAGMVTDRNPDGLYLA